MKETPAKVVRHAFVSGASIGGLSAAFWLHRAGWHVTVLEKADQFRDGGQNVDVRGVAHEVLDRMGLTERVKQLNTTETGTVMVDDAGEVTVELPSDGADGATAELEVLRGDLALAIRDALPPEVEIRYGDTIATVEDRDHGLTVTTEGGEVMDADLLVVAEGVRSSTRDLCFPDLVDEHDLGITMVFGTIAHTIDDDDRWRWYTTVGGRQAHLRPDNHGTTRAILAYADDETLLDVPRHDALDSLRRRFTGAGWQTPRILDGFDAAEDLYIDRLTQIHVGAWHRGSTCLLGDSAWCVTPLGGGGASLALVGGYVLAAYLSTPGMDIADALDRYEEWMRPVVDRVQKLPPAIDHLAYPRTTMGLKLTRLVTKAMASKPLASLAQHAMSATDTDQELPPLITPVV